MRITNQISNNTLVNTLARHQSQLARARYLLQDLITANEKGTKQNEAIAK